MLLNKLISFFFTVFACLAQNGFVSAVNPLTVMAVPKDLAGTKMITEDGTKKFDLMLDMPNIINSNMFTFKNNGMKWIFTLTFINLLLFITLLYNNIMNSQIINSNREIKPYVEPTVFSPSVPNEIQTTQQAIKLTSVVSKLNKKKKELDVNRLQKQIDELEAERKRMTNLLIEANQTKRGCNVLKNYYEKEYKKLKKALEETFTKQVEKSSITTTSPTITTANETSTKQEEKRSTATIFPSTAEANETTKTEKKK